MFAWDEVSGFVGTTLYLCYLFLNLACILQLFLVTANKKNTSSVAGYVLALFVLKVPLYLAFDPAFPTAYPWVNTSPTFFESLFLDWPSVGVPLAYTASRVKRSSLKKSIGIRSHPVSRVASGLRVRRKIALLMATLGATTAITSWYLGIYVLISPALVATLCCLIVLTLRPLNSVRVEVTPEMALFHKYFLKKAVMGCEIVEFSSDTSTRTKNALLDLDWGEFLRTIKVKVCLQYVKDAEKLSVRVFLTTPWTFRSRSLGILFHYRKVLDNALHLHQNLKVEWFSGGTISNALQFDSTKNKSPKLKRRERMGVPANFTTYADPRRSTFYVGMVFQGISGRAERQFKIPPKFEVLFIDQLARLSLHKSVTCTVTFLMEPCSPKLKLKEFVPYNELSTNWTSKMPTYSIESLVETELGDEQRPERVRSTKYGSVERFVEKRYEFSSSILVQTNESNLDVGCIVDYVAGLLHAKFAFVYRPIKGKKELRRAMRLENTSKWVWRVPGILLDPLMALPSQGSVVQRGIALPRLNSPPNEVTQAGDLYLGHIGEDSTVPRQFFLSVEDLKRHVFVCGLTGTGKTFLVFSLIVELERVLPHVPVLLFDFKGEYSYLQALGSNIRILRPGYNFGVNFFRPLTDDPHLHAERVLAILKSARVFDDLGEYTPQMERALVEILAFLAANPHLQCYEGFLEACNDYVDKNQARVPYLGSSIVGIQNRLRRFFSGPLRSIYEYPDEMVVLDAFKSSHVVDLRTIVDLGGTKEDVAIFVNMVLYYLWALSLSRGASQDIAHITIVDDAQYLVPSRGSSRFSSSFIEDVSLLLRGTGEAMVTLATRPAISENVIANAGAVFCFQVTLDEPLMSRLVGLKEEHSHVLKELPPRNCVVKLVRYPFPFLLKVRELAFNIPPTQVT
ncbi:MAG: hypothetical protein Kow0069_34370 [Promethearchaeota archaeon]